MHLSNVKDTYLNLIKKKKYLFKNYQRQLFAFNNYLYSTGQTNKLISIFTFWGVEPSIQRVVHIDKLVSYYLYMHVCVYVCVFFPYYFFSTSSKRKQSRKKQWILDIAWYGYSYLLHLSKIRIIYLKNDQIQPFAFNNYVYSTGQTNNLISILLFGGRTFNSKSDAYRQDCILLCNGFFNTTIEHTKDTAFHFSHIIMQ